MRSLRLATALLAAMLALWVTFTPSHQVTAFERPTWDGPVGWGERSFAASTGLIAYAGPDGNIWTINPDGSGRTRLTEGGSPQRPFLAPRWSPDGKMLVFAAGDPWNPEGIYLYANGSTARIPGVSNCAIPAFFPDGKRIALGCAREILRRPSLPSPQEARSDPSLGAVSEVNTDGSGWRVLVPYLTESLPDFFLSRVGRIDFSPADGTMLLNIAGGDGRRRTALVDPESTELREVVVDDDVFQAFHSIFAADGLDLLVVRCAGCNDMVPSPDAPPLRSEISLYGRDGSRRAIVASPWWISTPFDASTPGLSPDGQELVYAYAEMSGPPAVYVEPLSGGPRRLADGADPAWSSNASVTPR